MALVSLKALFQNLDGLGSWQDGAVNPYWRTLIRSKWLWTIRGVAMGVSFTSSSQNVPLISGLPGTRITLIAISRVCGPAV
jgi:hypothetical protein